jgi:hypothetical protein
MKKITREPSLHCSRSNLIKILEQVDLKKHAHRESIEDLVNELLITGSKYSLTNRKILANTQKLAKKVDKLVVSTLEDARLFSRTLLLVRRSLKHRGITPIKESSKDWLILKEVTQLALNFSNDFNLPKLEGFGVYLKIALNRMRGFALAKFNSMHPLICSEYEAKLRIDKDVHRNDTRKAHDIFNNILLEKTGQGFDYTVLPEKYQYFIDVVDEAKRLKVSTSDYIKAQFAAFDWKSAVPEVTAMVGPKAEERLIKYKYAHKEEITSNVLPIDFSKIRKPQYDKDNP